MDGAAVAGEMLGDAFDRAVALREQAAHDLVDFLLPAGRPVLDRLDPFAQIARDQGMRAWNPPRHVVCRHQDRIIVRVERHPAAEKVEVALAIVRRRVVQAHFQRAPVAAEERLDDAMDAAERHIDRLARRRRLPPAQMQRDDHGLPVLDDFELHAVMMNMDETREGLDGFADGRLLAHDQADGAEIGEAAALGEPQAEIFGTGRLRRYLEQTTQRCDGNRCIRLVENGQRQPDLAHHLLGIEPNRPGDLRVIAQACAANEVGHATCSCQPFRQMSRNVKFLSRSVKSWNRVEHT